MESKLKTALHPASEPVALIFSDEKPEGAKKENPRAFIGLTDISARRYLKGQNMRNMMTFTVPSFTGNGSKHRRELP